MVLFKLQNLKSDFGNDSVAICFIAILEQIVYEQLFSCCSEVMALIPFEELQEDEKIKFIDELYHF